MTGLPTGTPATVARAVALYAHTRRRVLLWTTALVTLSLFALTMLSFICLDRFVECSVPVRAAGPRAAVGVLLLGLLVGLAIRLLYRPNPRTVAIRLDQLFPENQDRWGTAIDLKRRLAKGEDVGHPRCVERLMEETETLTSETRVPGTVSRTKLWLSIAAGGLTLTLFVFLALSPAFRLPLLVQRFWQPRANLPRDSYTSIRVLSVNGSPVDHGQLAPLPEDSPFALEVAVERRTGFLPFVRRPSSATDTRAHWDPPMLDTPGDSALHGREFMRSGARWRFTIPRLSAPLAFRIRAADGLTAVFHQDILPRIKLRSITHSVQFPRYARIPNIEDQPLDAKRLSALVGSRIDFKIVYDRPFEALQASFETLRRSAQDTPAVLSRQDLLDLSHEPKQAAQTDTPERRPLKVRRRGDAEARFRLEVEEDGILRVQAVGRNGIEGLELIRVLEAVPDAPPRVTLSGIEPDTTIIPGETVAYTYLAEDDFAITDVIMDWQTAGTATSGDLAGEEYISSTNFGHPVVTGEELIQRMNYHVYGTSPFEFRLIATDSKGQEAKTPWHRIHIIDDDYAARLERAMQYIDKIQSGAAAHRVFYGRLVNQLNILSTVLGDSTAWPPAQKALHAPLAADVARPPRTFQYSDLYVQRFGGFPFATDRSANALSLPAILLEDTAGLRDLVAQALTSTALPATLEKIRRTLQDRQALATAWEAAVQAEHSRFIVPATLQRARKLVTRLDELSALSTNSALYRANRAFYIEQAEGVADSVEPLAGTNAVRLAKVEALREACARVSAGDVAARLRELAEPLAAQDTPLSEPLRALFPLMAKQAAGDTESREALLAAAGSMLRSRGHAPLFLPFDILALAESLPSGDGPIPSDGFLPAAQPGDLRLLLDRIRQAVRTYGMDERAGRHALYAQAGRDAADELADWMRILKDAAASCAGLPDGVRAAILALPCGRNETHFLKALSTDAEDMERKLAAAAQQLGTASLDRVEPTPEAPFIRLTHQMQALAKRYTAHAAGIRATLDGLAPGAAVRDAPAWRRLAQEAARLTFMAEGQEAWFRALNFVRQQRALRAGSPATDWARDQPFHGIQIGMTLVSVSAAERVAIRYTARAQDDKEPAARYRSIADNSDTQARDLLDLADLIESALKGQAAGHDFGPLMQRGHTVGHLESLEEESGFMGAFFTPTPSAMDTNAWNRLAASAFGKTALNERSMDDVRRAQQALAGVRCSTAAALAPVVAALGRTAAMLEDDALAGRVAAMARHLADMPGTAALTNSPALTRAMSAMDSRLDEVLTDLRSRLRLPPVNAMAASNRRFTSIKGASYIWTIQTIVDNFDRRWLTDTRDAELALVREMVDRGQPDAGQPPPIEPLALQYTRVLERRARGIANERRRNRGITFLKGDSGRGLKLPEHIAAEFLKARTRKPPDDFKERIEEYYHDLYRDLAD